MIDVPAGYSKEDLVGFRSVAVRDFPSLVPLIDDYIHMAERADTSVTKYPLEQKRREREARMKSKHENMHLFDLLREKRLFPLNSDLSDFAGKILPNMARNRFDKMSRGDIAARVIEYLESRSQGTREKLENSMREAFADPAASTSRRSFFSKWERIIKGSEL